MLFKLWHSLKQFSAKAKKMQAENKKAIHKLEREITNDEAEIGGYEASKQAPDDDDDDDTTSEGKKKHIKQVLISFCLKNC